jgi:hypothetical protein
MSERSVRGKNCRAAAAATYGNTGRGGGRARYVKEVNAAEATVRFAQEIYDREGRLVTVHEKFPVDLGHKRI